MEKLLLKKRIYQVQPAPETLEGWKNEMDIARTKWGRYFKTNDEFELFAMLPLTDEQRLVVLKAVAEEVKFNREIDNCTGKQGSTPEHRRCCIPCVLVDKRQIQSSN